MNKTVDGSLAHTGHTAVDEHTRETVSQRTMKTIVYTVAPSSHLLEAVPVERGQLGAWQSQWSLQVQTDKHIS